jgi:hypothetical protein
MDLNYKNSLLRKKNKDTEDEELPRYSLFERKFKELQSYNKYLLFYPESIIMNYLEEKELLKIALRILNKSNIDKQEAIEVMKIFDEKMHYYTKKYEEVNKNVRYRYYDVLLNLDKVYQINNVK